MAGGMPPLPSTVPPFPQMPQNQPPPAMGLSPGMSTVLPDGQPVIMGADGTLKFLPGRKAWPTQLCNVTHNPLQPKKKGTDCVQECIFIENSTQLTLTSSGTGTVRFCW